MSRKQYYTLAIREDGKWAPQFGDYDREVVAQELSDYADAGRHLKRDMRVIRSADDQKSIFAAVAALN